MKFYFTVVTMVLFILHNPNAKPKRYLIETAGISASHVDQDLNNPKVPDANLANEDATGTRRQATADADRRKLVYYTYFGKVCKDECKEKDAFGSKYWCYAKDGTLGSTLFPATRFDYCSPRPGYSIHGAKCTSKCEKAKGIDDSYRCNFYATGKIINGHGPVEVQCGPTKYVD